MSRPTPETDALVPKFLSGGEIPDIFAHARKLEQERDETKEKYDLEAVEHMLAINKICNERDDARNKVNRQAERIRVLEGATNHATGTPLSVAISERNDALNQLQGWVNKWKAAIDMAAIAEIKCDDLQEEVANLQDQRDLAMKVIKRLEEGLP